MRAVKILSLFEKKIDGIVERLSSLHPSQADYNHLLVVARRQAGSQTISDKAHLESQFHFSKMLIGYQAVALFAEEKKLSTIHTASKADFEAGYKMLEAIYSKQNRLKAAWKDILDNYKQNMLSVVRNTVFFPESEHFWGRLELLSFDASQWDTHCVQAYLELNPGSISTKDFIQFVIHHNASIIPQHHPARLSIDNGFMIARLFENDGRCIATHLPLKNNDDETNARLTQSFLSMIFREKVTHLVELNEPLKRARQLRFENETGAFATLRNGTDEMQLCNTTTGELRTIQITLIKTNDANQLNLDNDNIRMLHRAFIACQSSTVCVHSIIQNNHAEHALLLFALLNKLRVDPAFNSACSDAIKADRALDESFNIIYAGLSEEFCEFCKVTCSVFNAAQLKGIVSQFLLLAGVEMGLSDIALDHLREKIFSTKPLPHIVVTAPESSAIVSGVFSRRAPIVNPNLLSVPAVRSRCAMGPE